MIGGSYNRSALNYSKTEPSANNVILSTISGWFVFKWSYQVNSWCESSFCYAYFFEVYVLWYVTDSMELFIIHAPLTSCTNRKTAESEQGSKAYFYRSWSMKSQRNINWNFYSHRAATRSSDLGLDIHRALLEFWCQYLLEIMIEQSFSCVLCQSEKTNLLWHYHHYYHYHCTWYCCNFRHICLSSQIPTRMKTSWYGNGFGITNPLWGESTGKGQ